MRDQETLAAFGRRLAASCRRHSFDRADLARDSGRRRHVVDAHLDASAEPVHSDIVAYAYTLGVSVDTLLYDEVQHARASAQGLLQKCATSTADAVAKRLAFWAPQYEDGAPGTRVLGRRLRQQRLTVGLSAAALGKATPLSAVRIRAMERGREPALRELLHLFAALRCAANRLCVGSHHGAASTLEAQLDVLLRLPRLVSKAAFDDVAAAASFTGTNPSDALPQRDERDELREALSYIFLLRRLEMSDAEDILQVPAKQIHAWCKSLRVSLPSSSRQGATRSTTAKANERRKRFAQSYMAATTREARADIAGRAGVSTGTVSLWAGRFGVKTVRLSAAGRPPLLPQTSCAAKCRLRRDERSAFCGHHHKVFMSYFDKSASPSIRMHRGNMIVEGRVRMTTERFVPAPFAAGDTVRVRTQYGRVLIARANGRRGSLIDVATSEDGIKCVSLDGVLDVATWPRCSLSLTSAGFTLSPVSS